MIKSPFESLNNFNTDCPFSVAKLSFICKKIFVVNDEVRAGCPKLGHNNLLRKNFVIIDTSPAAGNSGLSTLNFDLRIVKNLKTGFYQE